MSLSVKISGTEYAGTSVRMRDANEQGISGLPASANGQGAQGAFILDDPEGDIPVQGWGLVEVEESACTAAPRLCTGYLADRTYRRGKYKSGPSREIDCTINDINVLLSTRLIDGNDGKRPSETRAARSAWIMGSDYLDGLVSDLGLMASADSAVFEEADFRGQYPSQVFDSIASGSIFFAYWDQTAEAVGMFFDLPDATSYTSTLTISNDLADVGPLDDPGTTCFPPYIDGELRADPSGVYSLIRLTWVGGVTVRTNATTAATFFPSPLLSRGVQEDSSRIGRATTAVTYADSRLVSASVERTTVTCTMRLPKSKIGLIDAGHRIFVKFTHLPGFETGAYTRVEEKSVVQTDGTREYYDLALTLSTSGLEGGRAGGGGSDGFPHIPPTAPTLVQSKLSLGDTSHTHSLTLDNPPSAGNLLVWVEGWRSSLTSPGIPTGFTQVDEDASSGGDCVVVAYRIAQAGDSATWNLPTPSKAGVMILSEWLGSWPVNPVDTSDTDSGAGVHPIVSITPTAGLSALIIGGAINTNTNTPQDWDYVAGTGYTLIDQSNVLGVGPVSGTPVTGAVFKSVAATSGSYAPDLTATPGFGAGSLSSWAEVAVAFVQDVTVSDDPPQQTQAFGPITPVETPDGATYTFTLPAGYEFADGSLRVDVNRLDQTLAVTSYDGAARTFVLSFAPWVGDVIEVYGQSR